MIFLCHRLKLSQPEKGYRTNADAFFLAAFSVSHRRARNALDLGAGVGAIGLSLVAMERAENVTLVERQEELVSMAQMNAVPWQKNNSIAVVQHDLCEAPLEAWKGAFDLVIANPPFRADGASLHPANVQRAQSRIAPEHTLLSFARSARFALGKAGRSCWIFPSAELERLLSVLQQVGLEPKRMRPMQALATRAPYAMLVEAKAAKPGGLIIEPPLVVQAGSDGIWTPEARGIVDGLAASWQQTDSP